MNRNLRFFTLLASIGFSLGLGRAAESANQLLPSTTTVTVETIRSIEDQVVMPPKTSPLPKYERFYAAARSEGREIVVARFLEGFPGSRRGQPVRGIPNAFVTEFNNLPGILDGGCSVISVYFDVATGKLLGPPMCSGEA